MQLEDMSKDELIALVKRQEQELAARADTVAIPMVSSDALAGIDAAWEDAFKFGAGGYQLRHVPYEDMLLQPVHQPAPAPAFDAWYHRKTHMSREHAQIAFDAGYAAAGQGQQPAPVAEHVGYFIKEGIAWVQTSSDDPRGVKFYAAPVAAPVANSNSVEFAGIKTQPDTGRDAALEEAAAALENLCYGAENGGGGTVAERLRQAQRVIRGLAAHPANVAQPLKPMGEDGNEWYFDCDGHYIDIKRDAAGKYSVYFRNQKDGSEAYSDQADANVAQVGELSDAQIIDIAVSTRSAEANKDGGYMLPISFARAIIAAMYAPAKTYV